MLKQGLYVNSRLSFHSSIGQFAAVGLPVVAGGHSVSQVFPNRKLSHDHDPSGKRSQEEEAE